jgi:hypothetical protein
MNSVFEFGNYRYVALLATSLVALTGLAFSEVAISHEQVQQNSSRDNLRHVPEALAVTGELSPPPAGVTDLKFRELFKLPIGPRGLEPSEKLIGLNGKLVRMVGYMAKEENPTSGMFILSPLPVNMGDEDESFADDLPASAVFVHLESARNEFASYLPGLIKLTGVLKFGTQQEPDGRVSVIRLMLDPAPVNVIVQETAGNALQRKTSSATNVANEVGTNKQMKFQPATPKPLPPQPSNHQEKQL